MNIEYKRIESGHVTLDKLAIPETVKVTLLGETIIPVSFDCYGHPNFTEEQQMLFIFKEEELKRKTGGYTPLKAKIVYNEKAFDVPRWMFDTAIGIEENLGNLYGLNKMLEHRRIFHKAYNSERLNEFMILGYLLLDQFGQVMSLEKKEKDNIVSTGDVEPYEIFRKNNSSFTLTFGGDFIPKANSVCPCCGRQFVINDVRYNLCVCINGKFYHDSCWHNYRKLTEVDKLTRQLMNNVYRSTDYHFELLPNGYWTSGYRSHIPWLLFHTIDGDIIMGWRKRVISIEWQENYKPFDMKELFSTENVTKWEKGGKRGIHAWSNEKAYEYLRKVLKFIHPHYSEW